MRYFVFICFNLLFFTSISQNEIHINQYGQNVFAVSPAISSLSDHAEAHLYYKKLWGGFSESPELSQVMINGPIKNKRIGLGLNFVYQQIGLFSGFNAEGSFSYKLKLNDKNALSFGLQMGLKRLQINFNKINAQDEDEFFDFPLQQTSTVPTADFSVAYKSQAVTLFAGANQLLPFKFKYSDPSYQPMLSSQLVPNYFIGGKWDKAISSKFDNSVFVILRSHQGLPLQTEISDMVTWQHKFSIGLGYRQTYNSFVTARVQLSPSLTVGYSYEYTVNKLNTYTRGGHEINLCYKFNKPKEPEPKKQINSNEVYEELEKINKQLEANKKVNDSIQKDMKQLKKELAHIQKINGVDSAKQAMVNRNIKGGNTNTTINDNTVYHSDADETAGEIPQDVDSLYKIQIRKNTNDIDSLTNEVNELWEELNKLKIKFANQEEINAYIDSLKRSNELLKDGKGKPVKGQKGKTERGALKKATKGKNKGKQQLMLNKKGTANSRKPSQQKTENNNTLVEDDQHIRVEAIAKDKKTSKPVHAEITVTEVGAEKPLPSNGGNKWQGLIEKNKKYKLEAKALGYQDAVMEVDSGKKDIVVLMEALKVGDNFVMNSIYFHPNTYALKRESEADLQKLLEFLVENPGTHIEIQGHTNGDKRIARKKGSRSLGSEWSFSGSSKKLSAHRAEVIRDILIQNGIAAGRLTIKGYGGSKPIIEHPETMSQGQKNIRVEIEIIKK
jgi:type IX secretion system PorP/SprF family membrane protein